MLMRFFFRRDRVITGSAPRMAAAETADAEIQTFDNAVDLDSLYHILGASWTEAANTGEKGGYKFLVALNQQNQKPAQQFSHLFCFREKGFC